jgi:hypothetical protein
MFPLDPMIVFFAKFFVFVTCVFFWLRLFYHWLARGYRRRHHRDDWHRD